MKKLLVVIMALAMVFALASTVSAAAGEEGDPYTNLTSGNYDPTLGIDLTGSTHTGSDYFLTATGNQTLTVTPTFGSGTSVTVTGFDAAIDTAAAANPTTTPASETLNFTPTGKRTVHYTIVFNVTGTSTPTTEYYRITGSFDVYVGSAVKTLSTVKINVGGTDYNATLVGSTYTAHVPTGTTGGGDVTATTTNEQATVKINAEAAVLHTQTVAVTNLNDCTIIVTPENGASAATYTLKIKADRNSATITGLTLSSPPAGASVTTSGLPATTVSGTLTRKLITNVEFTFNVVVPEGATIANGATAETNCTITNITGTAATVKIATGTQTNIKFDLRVTAIDGTTMATYNFNLTVATTGDFDDVGMRLTGTKGGTYLSTNDFDPDDTTYDIDDIDEDETEVTLRIYYDNDNDDGYDVDWVKYDNSTSKVDEGTYSTSGDYQGFDIKIDPDELEDITVKITDNESDISRTYTISLDGDSSDFDIDMEIKDDDGNTLLKKSSFDPEDTSWELDEAVGNGVDYINLYVYYDDTKYEVTSVKYDGKTISEKSYSSGKGTYKITVDPDNLTKITVKVKDLATDDTETYSIDLAVGGASLTSMYLYGINNSSIIMSPTFNTAIYNYVAKVGSSVSSINLFTTSADTIKVSQNGGGYITKSASSASYILTTGLNTFDILVGTSTHYYLNVYREAATTTIVPSSQSVSINSGTAKHIAAYNINGNNFVKLRDLAYMLKDSAKKFSVTYSATTNKITLTSGSAYSPIGGELTLPSAYKNAVLSPQTITLNGNTVAPMAYNIDGYNYYLLRDLAALLDFKVTYSGTTVSIDTAYTYGGIASGSSSSNGDFSGIDMQLKGEEGGTYLSKITFKPDEIDYDVDDIDADEEEVTLTIYYDKANYSITSVKYGGSTKNVDANSYSTSSKSQTWDIEIDPDDLEEITIVVKDLSSSESETYTITLDD